MDALKVTMRDRITDALERRVRIAAGLNGPRGKATRHVASAALTAWQAGEHPIEAAEKAAEEASGRYASGNMRLAVWASHEAREIDRVITTILDNA